VLRSGARRGAHAGRAGGAGLLRPVGALKSASEARNEAQPSEGGQAGFARR